MDRRIEQILFLIQRKQFRVQECARELGVSVRTIQRIFKKQTGVSLKQYELDLKLSRAADLLLVENSMQISEICYKAGFNDPNSFSKQFRRKYGCTPTTFRKVYQDEAAEA